MTDLPTPPGPSPLPREVAAGGVVLTLTPDQVYVEFADTATPRDVEAVLARYRLRPVPVAPGVVPPQDPGADLPRHRWLGSATGDDLAPVVAELRAADRVRSASPVYHRADLLPELTGHGFADDLLVRFAPGAADEEVSDLIAATGTTVVAAFPDAREGTLVQLRLGTPPRDAFAVVDAFARSPLVRYAGPNWVQLQSPSSATTPDDARFPEQWNLERIGAPAGWDITQGSAGVVIAIVDSGCDLTHPDLVDQYVPVADRGDVIDNTNSPHDLHPRGGHGTLCAGVAAAQTDNTIGVAGVAPKCRIMPIRLYWGRDDRPPMTELQVIAAIDWARTHGADVVSMSWFFTSPHANADIALNNAHAAGLVLVAAAGNCVPPEPVPPGSVVQRVGCIRPASIPFPGSHPKVMTVGASDRADHRKDLTSPDGGRWQGRYGPQLSVVAPGVIPWTTTTGGGFGDFSGTSAAAPHVAGLAALIISLLRSQIRPWWSPTHLNRLVRDIIETTAMKVGGYGYANDPAHPNGTWHEEMGYGRIDVARALRYARDNYTDYRFEHVSRDYARAVQILVGLAGGGPGVVLPPGGPPVPVDPGWRDLAPEQRDVLLGLAVTALAEGVDDPEARRALGRAGWAAIEQTAQRMAGDA